LLGARRFASGKRSANILLTEERMADMADEERSGPGPESTGGPAGVERNDLGFGRVVAERTRGRLVNKDGTPNSRRYGLGRQTWSRLYLRALEKSWPEFLLYAIGLALLLAGVFAIGYRSLGPGALSGTEALGLSDPFFIAFAYSVSILTGIGAGPVVAVGSTAQWLTILESMGGLLGVVLTAGLTLARLSRPRAQIRFSQRAVVAPYRGGRGLMFRLANVEPGELSDAEARVSLAWLEQVGEGRERRFHQLALERQRVEFFSLNWTVVHPIDRESPLAGVTPEELREAKAEVLVLLTAHEETFSTRVTARSSYLWNEVAWDARFADMFVDSPDGIITVDMGRLDRVERLPEGSTSRPAPAELGPVERRRSHIESS
jgi:inward rectifier potassium channel